ncbi:hypothetical protein [Gracilimonas tropica]|uniref:hypothetical protein n=1 Tax=Gracilimonas tropica TaxID=454600 RepID=UPI0003678682|nr:hypothetical protein [Gracilimonas tropica]
MQEAQQIPEMAQWIVESGLSAALLGVLIWVVKKMLSQFDQSSTQAFQALKEISEAKDKQLKEAFDQHVRLSEKILSITKDFHEEEAAQRDLLTRILTRMEEKLDQPVRCPAQIHERTKDN